MKVSFSYAMKTWGIYLVLVLIAVLFLAGTSGSALMMALNVVLVAGFALLAFNDGAYNGEKACTLEASIEKQLKEGRVVDERTRQYTFSRKTGVVMFAICLAPFLLLSVLNLAVAPLYPANETAEVEEVEREPFTYDYEAAENPDRGSVNVVNVVARVVFMPYVFTYNLVSASVLNLLFLLYSFVIPSAAFVGYMMGPRLRMKKLHDIALGKKRKMRNLKVNKGPRRPKAEV